MLKLMVLLFTIFFSSFIYIYLHHKAHIRKIFLLIDNVIVIILTYLSFLLIKPSYILSIFLVPFLILFYVFVITMIRFWRTPKRKLPKGENIIVSPADGNIIYIKKLESGATPISVKKGKISKLHEITKTDLTQTPCWLIGINMTPFDVHKNCAPIAGKVILQKHTHGKFLSLKELLSETENERNTFVIENDNLKIGVVQIASRRVRRIVSYVKEGEMVEKGQWLGMIKFGSQVDVILPINTQIKVKIGQQIYAKKTILAVLEKR